MNGSEYHFGTSGSIHHSLGQSPMYRCHSATDYVQFARGT